MSEYKCVAISTVSFLRMWGGGGVGDVLSYSFRTWCLDTIQLFSLAVLFSGGI